MRKLFITLEQILYALKQAELDTSVPEFCRKLGIFCATFCIWCRKYGRITPSELKYMWQFEEENLGIKKLVAELSIDKAMLQNVLVKKSWCWHACASSARDLETLYVISESQACFPLKISRELFRYRSIAPDDSAL